MHEEEKTLRNSKKSGRIFIYLPMWSVNVCVVATTWEKIEDIILHLSRN